VEAGFFDSRFEAEEHLSSARRFAPAMAAWLSGPPAGWRDPDIAGRKGQVGFETRVQVDTNAEPV
jgi:hypothetical protein